MDDSHSKNHITLSPKAPICLDTTLPSFKLLHAYVHTNTSYSYNSYNHANKEYSASLACLLGSLKARWLLH